MSGHTQLALTPGYCNLVGTGDRTMADLVKAFVHTQLVLHTTNRGLEPKSHTIETTRHLMPMGRATLQFLRLSVSDHMEASIPLSAPQTSATPRLEDGAGCTLEHADLVHAVTCVCAYLNIGLRHDREAVQQALMSMLCYNGYTINPEVRP